MLVDANLQPVSRPYVDADGTQHPADIEEKWSSGELAAKGWHRLNQDPRPTDARVIRSEIVWRNGEAWRQWITEPLPPQRRYVDIALILDRLDAGGFRQAATAAFDQLDRWDRERFYARTQLWVEDPVTLALLASIGADPAVILAPPDGG